MHPKALAGFILVMTLMISGCNVGTDVEALLRPPHPAGEQRDIQESLEEYIGSAKHEGHNAPGGYALKYPNSGEYRSAFVIKDIDGDGVDEAMVFYRLGIESGNIHLNFLKKDRSEWKSVCDIEGAGTNVEIVKFADLDKNGISEILIGWNMDNVRDKQLAIYQIKGNQITEWHKDLYTEFVVDILTDSGRESVLIIRSNVADNIATARLLATGADSATGQTSLVEIGSTVFDGDIQRFTNIKTVDLNNTVRGVYADAVKGTDSMVTELIYWDGKQLRAPFYNKDNNSNNITDRNTLLPSMDLDGDGVVEWPKIKNITGYNDSNNHKIWLTGWESFDINTQAVSEKFSCIINMTDKYYVLIEDSWSGLYTVEYRTKTHTMSLLSLAQGSPYKSFLVIRAVYDDTHANADNDLASVLTESTVQPVFEELDKTDSITYLAWVSNEKPFNLSMERLRYIVSLLQ